MIQFRNLTKRNIKTAAYKKIYNKIFVGKKFELSVVFAGRRLMTRLHREYMGKSGPANVLSFLLEKERSGELFLNAGCENPEYLFVHGCLHLLGFDHKRQKDAELMERREMKIIKIR